MPVVTRLPDDTPWQHKADLPQVTLRSTLAGLTIGSVILISNFQFGLQTGWVSMMSLPSALLGFSIFKTLQGQLGFPFTDVENVFVQSVAVAVATGPLTYGFVGIIPAIEKLMTDEESGYVGGIGIISLWKLITWSFGLSFFGVFFAIPLRKQFVIKEQLPFPSGSATATLISVFHGTSMKVEKETEIVDFPGIEHPNKQQEPSESEGPITDQLDNPNNLTIIESQDLCRLQQLESYQTNIKLLFTTATFSSSYTIISYFVPQIKSIPLFGSYLSRNYLLNFQPSPAYVGQGIIMGLATTTYMFVGMVLGWCILAPIAKHNSWAPGAVDDWKEGAEGWIMWISLSIMISDSIVSLLVLTIKGVLSAIHPELGSSTSSSRKSSSFGDSNGEERRLIEDDNEVPSDEDVSSSTYHGISSATQGISAVTGPMVSDDVTDDQDNYDGDVDSKHQLSSTFTITGLIVSSIMCILTTRVVFGPMIPYYAITVSILLSLLLSVLGVKALGETDLNPVSGIGKLSQLIFALIIPKSQPGAILINLISGAISEAATQQAGDLLQDLKTGYLLGASPKSQFIAQVYGSIFSVGLSAVMYKVYNALYEIPGKVFKIPTAVIWIDCARLVNGQGLPPYVPQFSLFFGAIFGVISLLKNTIGVGHKWHKWMVYLPSGVPVGIGIYNTPSFTLARFVGGLISYLWMKRGLAKVRSLGDKNHMSGDEKVRMIIFSSGLVLGEGLFSVFNMLLTAFGVPHL
ncbi:hypothetical protein CANARDRAFT_8747 [[Candida] arabinofermentans NRRL YB-2248]|uniref:OPT superfamily oligopeptide transporter n=1 Tax=[Candida] arabinofermentans NRRL YB-2248 TaxID=983967 RepID=A0A1E4SY13_9ASCO|nr:hypothetical protein CANARDRAFT_8747 [[Candida] arabinofermentans NRRL YB-2248]